MAEVRTKILEEATRMFARRGFDGTSLSALSDAVGIRKPSLLYHFENKDALRDAVLDGMLMHWRNELPKVLMQSRSGPYRIDTAIGAMAAFFSEDPDRARLVIREVLDRPDAIQTRLETHLAPWTGLITDYIRNQQERGNVHPDIDPEAYVLQVVMMVIGTIASGDVAASMLGTRHASIDDQIHEAVRIARTALFLPDKLQSEQGA